MRTLKTGLISAGGVSKSFLARMPALLNTIGPVKATSFRVARRITNSLRAGHAVEPYSALEKCDLVWIAVPESALDRILAEFSTQAAVHGRMIAICGTARSSSGTGLLRGARLATLNVVPGDERTLIAEGHPSILREFRRLIAAEQRKLIEIEPQGKALYQAGVHLASDLLLPYFSAGVETLRTAGFSRSEAARIAEGLAARALRAYAKAGKKAWRATTALDLRRSRECDLDGIREVDPRRASLYERGMEQALEYFKI